MKFQQPIGAVRDVKELEYMVALHQSKHNDKNAFMDGSIDASDVKTFLRSRYGIEVTKEQVRDFIFKGLGGGDDVDECIDIVEIVTIMIIPLLVKVSKRLGDGDNDLDEEMKHLEPPSTIIADVLKCILMDANLIKDGEGKEDVLKNAPKLTPNILKAIFLEYDEFDLLQDNDLVEKMVADATGGKEDAVLDVETFARALTQDVELYNIDNETRHTSIMDDVYPDGFNSGIEEDTPKKDADEETAEEKSKASNDVRAKTTFSAIDFTADNVVSWVHVSLVWLLVVFTYIVYFYGAGHKLEPCSGDGFGCKVAKAIVGWVQIMLTLVIMGLVLGVGLSMGNGEFDNFILSPLIGIASVVVLVFLPAVFSIKNFAFRTDLYAKDSHSAIPWAKYILVGFGTILLLLQIRNLIALTPFGKRLRQGKGFLSDLIKGSNGKASYMSKQAGIYKVNVMVRNAYDLHKKISVEKAGGKDAEEMEEKKNNIFSTFTAVLKGGEPKEEEEEPNKEDARKSKSDIKDEFKAKNQSRKGDKSTKELALENFSNLMDETEEAGGFGWAFKAFLSGSLQQTEGIWLSSRLIAAVILQLVAVAIIFTASILAATAGVDMLYPDLTVDYTEDCFGIFDYDNCYFPWGDGFYSGVAVCKDMYLANPKCYGEQYWKEIPQSNELRQQSCKTIDTVINKLASTIPGNLTCGFLFDQWDGLNESINVTSDVYSYCDSFVRGLGPSPYVNLTEEEEGCVDLVSYTQKYFVDKTIENFPDGIEGFPNLTLYDAFEYCVNVYNGVEVALPCDKISVGVYTSTDPIRVYESKSTKEAHCESVMSVCAVGGPLINATCIIGEENFQPFQFEGDTCRDYPDINATLQFYEENVAPGLQQAADIYPKKWQVRFTISVAIIVGTLVSLATSLVYIPSSIHTIMKFRCGNIPSLRDPAFLKYRTGLQNMAYMIGAMFWGLVATTTTLTLVIGIVVFLLVWHVTNQYLKIFVAQIIGIVATLAFKIVFCMLFMKFAYSGYYRKRPAAANIFTFALESWYLALTAAFVLSRVVKFLVATGLYIGRIDRPVLADGLLLDLDSLPRVFRQNLLSTEAHRHPYIELLGLMYLMKLRHKDNFGTDSGTAWRLIFVTALMPWLKKKRIEGTVDELSEDKKYQLGLLVDEIFAATGTMN